VVCVRVLFLFVGGVSVWGSLGFGRLGLWWGGFVGVWFFLGLWCGVPPCGGVVVCFEEFVLFW